MSNNYSKISLTYTLGGEHLVKQGEYSVAKVKVINGFKDNEVFSVLSPSQTITKPEYKYATQNITLSEKFVKDAYKRPTPPEGRNINWWLRTEEGKLFKNWNKLTPEQRVDTKVAIYVDSVGGRDYSFELI